jgi:hypothetical protein
MIAAVCGAFPMTGALLLASGPGHGLLDRRDTIRIVVEWSGAARVPDSVALYATVLRTPRSAPEVVLDRAVTGTRDSFSYAVTEGAGRLRFALSGRAFRGGRASPRTVVEWEYPSSQDASAVRRDSLVPGRYTIRLDFDVPALGGAGEQSRPALAPPPPPRLAQGAGPAGPGPSGKRPDWCRNEPPGFETLSDQRWEDGVPVRGRKDRAGWVLQGGGGRLRMVADPDAPPAAGQIIEGTFPRGMPGGRGPFRMDRDFEHPVSAVYMCLWHKLDPQFTNNGNTGTKFGFLLTPYQGGSTGLNHYFNLTDRLGVNLQSAGGRLNRNMFSQFNMMANRGRWHLLEFLVVGNSGEADGVARIWVDGREVMHQRNVRFFFSGQRPAFSGVTWNPTYGGGLNPVPRDLYQRIGRWYISGRR